MSVYRELPFLLVKGSVPPAHRGDPWFEDGTVSYVSIAPWYFVAHESIIQVILTSGCTAFKVYKGLLSRDSQVFATLLNETPLDRLVKTRIEGCEVIRMDEPVSKLRPVLQWIHGGTGKYDPNYFIPIL